MLVTNIHQIFSKCHLPGQTGWSLHKGSSPELSQFRTLQSWFPFLSSVFIFFMILFYRNELYRITDACITTKLKRGQSKSFNSMAHMMREDNMYKPRPLLHLIFFFLAQTDSQCPSSSVQWRTAHFLRLCCQQQAHPLNHTHTLIQDPAPLLFSSRHVFLSIIGPVLTNE